MVSFWRQVNKVIQRADIILELVDARMVSETRNWEVESKIEHFKKKILYVINKSDLIGQEEAENLKKQLVPSVFVSSTKKQGTTMLLHKILEISHGEPVTVGIIGYPNVGKSSLINALSGKGSAKTSSTSNFTKGIQFIRINDKITLIDTPGVFSNKEKDEMTHGITGAVGYGQIKDPVGVALKLIEENKKILCDFYKVQASTENEEILKSIGHKYQRLAHGGEINEDATARIILKDWQSGKIRKALQK